LEQAEEHGQEIRELDVPNDVMWKCFGSQLSGGVCGYLGRFIDARAHSENALSLWDPTFRALSPMPEDPHVRSLIFLSRALLCLGYLDQARSRRNEALADARRLSPYNLIFGQCIAWYGDWAIEGVGSARTMLRSAEKILAISGEQGFPLWFGSGTIIRGWCLGALGETADAIQLMLQGLDIRRATGANLLLPFHLTTLAEVYGIAGQPQQGLNRLSQAEEFIEKTQERWAEAEMHRMRGTLLLSINEHTAAEESYGRALTVARRQHAKFWELRAALDLARFWHDQGKRTEARDLLAPIYGWFTEGFDTPVLQDAKALSTSWRDTIHPLAGWLSDARQGHELVRRRHQPYGVGEFATIRFTLRRKVRSGSCVTSAVRVRRRVTVREMKEDPSR
jgi:tetratricopeptide (TPR) repeat protein